LTTVSWLLGDKDHVLTIYLQHLNLEYWGIQ
jgi:hypothetical protein